MTPSQKELPVEWVTKDLIRQVFNKGNYFERIKSGELIAHLTRNSHQNPPPTGEPFCTHSQILYYYTKEDTLVAVVHQYHRPDGNIGGSGLPDPKRLVLPDKILAVRSISRHD
jgi:hypothetical protein